MLVFARMFGAIALVTTLAAFGNAQAQSPPDVVRLKSGGLLRGTISELVPGDRVTIVLITGEVRTISFGDIEYAGPDRAAVEPGSSARAAAPQPSGTSLRLTAPNDDLTYYLPSGRSVGNAIVTGSAVGVGFGGGVTGGVESTRVEGVSYDRLCIAPCTISVESGNYRFAIGEKEEAPVLVEDSILIDRPATLAASYRSYEGLRIAGRIVSGAALITGLALAIHWVANNSGRPANSDLDPTQPLIGAGIALGGGIVGYIMSSKGDEARIDLLPPE